MRKITNKIQNSWFNLIKGEDPKFIYWIFPLAMALVYLVIPSILTAIKNPFGLDFTSTGQIGDTIGGITSPIIAMVAAFLTFLAFWVQFQSNKKQTAQFLNQDNYQKIERFENKFYNLLNLHINNIKEIEIDNKVSGKNIFVTLFDELHLSYRALNYVDSFQWPGKITLSTHDKINISYLTFFIGIKNDSITLLKSVLKKYPLNFIDMYLKEIQDLNKKYNSSSKQIDGPAYANNYTFLYRPFEGHLNRLGHYYRHLFQIFTLIDLQQKELDINKYEYGKIVRSQLSVYEQLMLYYNIQSVLGQDWIRFEYIEKFKVFRNMPKPLATFGLTPEDFFDMLKLNIKDHFEWDIF